MTTKYKIAEQVIRLLDGNQDINTRVHLNDIKLLIEQACNQILKADYFQTSLPEGDVVPNNAMIFTYDNVPVTSYKGKSKCSLPAFPINLPRNLGVLHVSKTDAIDEPFIPIPASLYGVVKPQALLGDLSGLIGYEVVGRDVIVTKDLTTIPISNVFMRLVGVDLAQLTDYDPLPLSSDMELTVVTQVYNMVSNLPDKKEQ